MTQPQLDHNVYILGAGFSFDAGLPLLNNFLMRMADCLDSGALDDRGRAAILKVFEFRLRAAAAAYRSQLNVENIEELFSLASALEGEQATEYISTAIATTLDLARRETPALDCKVITRQTNPEGGALTNLDSRSSVPLYQIYAEILNGNFCDRPERTKNSIITFNYDTLLEDGLHLATIPFTYGIPEELARYDDNCWCTRDGTGIPVYKLHGSVNWSTGLSFRDRVRVHNSYDWLKGKEEQVFLVPPTWRKIFGAQLASVWEGAVSVLSDATRIIVLGFSMPPTDTHFKYLLIAGLQDCRTTSHSGRSSLSIRV
jgi:hypothetical protein